MLQELSIRNFAIIEDLTIRFEDGLTILSGETGAGKSIIINAVNLLLGSRATAALIRKGADSAELEAMFAVPPGSRVAVLMDEAGYDPEEGLLVRRIISISDRHRIYINGRLSTLQTLTAITANLASISGQHAHQGLLKEEEHLQILDQFGGAVSQREEYQACFRQLGPMIREEQALLRQQQRQDSERELLRFQAQEIDAAELLPAEDETLEKERLRLKNGQFLFETAQQCVDALYSADGAVAEQLGHWRNEMEKAVRLDETLGGPAADLADLVYRVEDVVAHLRDYLRRIDLDPARLESVEARLDQINKLKRKYGGSLASLQTRRDEIARALGDVENLDQRLVDLRARIKDRYAELCRLSSALTAKRRAAARRLSSLVEKELASLKMADTRFQADIQPLPAGGESSPYLSDNGRALGENGSDRVAFMIAPNVGEGMKPLTAIASGGELSRIVLALKAILAQTETLETVVFDEVDAGIGGGTAEVVGKKIAGLARSHQILCITHLPQIAKYGDHHFRIAKTTAKGRTHTTIASLAPEERVEEIARMLGGEKITATTLKHARELLGA